MPSDAPRRAGLRWAALLFAALALSGCGAQPTGHGAPPYDDDAGTSVTTAPQIRTRYPGLDLTFSLPPMAGPDQPPVAAFVEYEAAVVRALRTNHLGPALRRLSAKPQHTLLRRLVALNRKYGATQQGAVRIDIGSVTTATASSVRFCARGFDGRPGGVAQGALLVQRKSGAWVVQATYNLKKPLRGC